MNCMLISELLQESPDQFKKLMQSYSQYRYVIGRDDSWAVDASLSPYAVITQDFIDQILTLDPELQHKTLFDSFYGFFPHEYDEANVTIALCRGKVDSVLAKYPHYEMSPKIYQKLKQTNLSDRDIYNAFSIHDKMTPYTYIGGEAHEIVISANPSAYNKFIGM